MTLTLFTEAAYRMIDGWPGYRVGSDGEVWSCRTFQGRLGPEWHRLSPRPDRDGYLSVVLQNHGKRQTIKVSHLVLTAFVGPRPDGCEARHFPDPSPANNTVDNLRWGTHHQNIMDKVAIGTVAKGEGHGSARLTESDVVELRRLRGSGWTFTELARHFSISTGHACSIARRRTWRHVA